MKRVLTLLLILLSLHTFSREEDKTFLDEHFKPVPNMSGAKYYRTVSVNQENLFYAEVFYLTDQPQMKGHYLDIELTTLHGDCAYFHRNGKIESEGQYEKGKRVGVWKRFTLFGEKRLDRYYASKHELIEKSDLPTCLASFKKIETDLSDFLQDHLMFPYQATLLDLTQGRVHMSLLIDETGTVTGHEVLSSTSYAFTQEAEKMLQHMPQWNPALNTGEAVESNFIIKIIFDETTLRERPSASLK